MAADFTSAVQSPLLKDCVFEFNTAEEGGGVWMHTANPRFVDCTIRNNSASEAGGGVHIINSSATFTRCDIVGNISGTGDGMFTNGAGGGLFAHRSTVIFRGGRISGNSSTYGGGGVQHAGDWSVRSILRLEDVEIADNTVRRHPIYPTPTIGGGVNTEENATTSILRSRILRNRAENGGGLGVSLGRYDIVDSTIRENQATTGAGGGIAGRTSVFATPAKPASIVTLTRSIVGDNTAPMAGGIASLGDVPSQQGATLRLTESVVSGNQSQSYGGGILASATFLTLVNSLVINNTVSGAGFAHGGGIFLTTYSWAAIDTTTIAHNTAAGLGGGLFVNSEGNAIEMSSSQVYGNAALATGGGLFIGGGTTGIVHGNILADNAGVQSNAQVVEDGGACSSVTYPNNLITALASDGCPSLPSRMPGTDSSSKPRFVTFLVVPRSGIAPTLAWSAARATSVTIAGVATFAESTGLTDVAPAASTTYTLTATASDADGGAYGPVSVRAVVRPPALGTGAVDGDLDGDGQAELVVYRPSAGDWFHWNVTQAAGQFSCGIFCGEPTGNPSPAMGDFDGDGRADAVWFTPSTGNWHVVHATNFGTFDVLWGNAADRLVPADYDGDGRTDIAVFRPSDGVWYLRLSSTGATPSYAWGNAADIPVPADYDGDGRADSRRVPAVGRHVVGVFAGHRGRYRLLLGRIRRPSRARRLRWRRPHRRRCLQAERRRLVFLVLGHGNDGCVRLGKLDRHSRAGRLQRRRACGPGRVQGRHVVRVVLGHLGHRLVRVGRRDRRSDPQAMRRFILTIALLMVPLPASARAHATVA